MEKVKSIKQLNYYYFQGVKELLFCINIDNLSFDDVLTLSSYAFSDMRFIGKDDLVVNDKIIEKCRETISKSNLVVKVPTKVTPWGKVVKDTKKLVSKLTTLRDLICAKEHRSFTKEVRDDEFYSAGVIDTEEVEYVEYTPMFKHVVTITNSDKKVYMRMTHGYCINSKETKPLIEKVKGLTVQMLNQFGEVDTFDYKAIRERWVTNRLNCKNECIEYSTNNPINDNNVVDKLGMVLSVYGPHKIIKDDLEPTSFKIYNILKDAGFSNEEMNIARYKIIKQEPKAVDAFINYCLEKNIKIYNFVDVNKIEELYETVKPEYYGNANYLEAQIYNFTEDAE